MTALMTEALASADPHNVRGDEPTVREVMDRLATRLESEEFFDECSLADRGDLVEGERLLRDALAQQRETSGPLHYEVGITI